MKNLAPQRVAAVDVFRALTMFLMLFVNDIPGLKNIPHWLEHADINEDMMGFSDTIFQHSCLHGHVCLFCHPEPLQERRYYASSHCPYLLAYSSTHHYGAIFTQFGWHSRWHFPPVVLYPDGYRFFLVWAVYPKTEGSKSTYSSQ